MNVALAGWLGGGIMPYTKRLWVRFPVRAFTWAAGSINRQRAKFVLHIDVSLALPSPPLSLSQKSMNIPSVRIKKTEPTWP